MKRTKQWLSLLLSLIMVLSIFTGIPMTASAATSLPNSIYITQATNYTCTLASATMMLRARAYLSGCNNWSSITEGAVKTVAWGSGLKWSFTYSNSEASISVAHTTVSGISVSTLKSLLNSHPEGIVLYCGNQPHAVFVTDYDGDTFYCSDPASGYSGDRRTLTASYLSKKYNTQASILSNTTAYWYVSSYNISGTHTHSYDTYVYYWKSHPHYKCYKCSCGEVKENTSEPTYIDSCAQCRVGKTTVCSDKDVYCPGERIELSWDAASNATHYNFYIMKKNSNGEYTERVDWIREYKQTSYSIHGLPVGDYMIRLYSYDSKHWESDGSDWCHEMADLIYFSVKEYKATPVATTTFNNNTYEIYNISMPWTEAKAYCEYVGGHLVTITSQGEQDNVRELISQGGRYCYWMGMTDEDNEGNWVNITGEPINYSNWITDEPNNQNGDEHYGVVRNLDGNNWNDVKNLYTSNSIGFICEYEKNTETIEFTMKGGEDSVSVSWTEISSAAKYELSVTDEQGNIKNIESSETSIEWNPDEGGSLFGDLRVQVKAYDSTGVIVGESAVELYEIWVNNADWWGECGDADFDDKITIKDATFIQKYIAGIEAFSDAAKSVADVVVDSVVNIKDATAIQKYIAGITTDSKVGERMFYGWQDFVVVKKQQSESDWVLVSQVPEGAQITDRKYTYTLTETTTSTSSSMSGWTMTGSSWEQTGSGTHKYASYPGGFSTSNSLYSKYSKSAINSSESETAKRTVSDASTLTYIYWHWCRGDDSLGAQYNRRINEVYTSEFNTFDAFESTTAVSYDSAAEAYKYVNTSCCGDCYWWMRTTVYSQTYTDYQKIYSFSKTIQLESDAAPSGSSISNVQEWVKYIY